MYLEYLQIRRFRNLAKIETDFSPGPHLLWGENAQGKTNVLEAIYFLVTGRSFRTRTEKECLPWPQENGEQGSRPPTTGSLIRGRVKRSSSSHELQVALVPEGKRVAIDEKPVARLGRLFGHMNAVLFTPADLSLVQDGPAGRRQFLDSELTQIDPVYLDHLQRFTRALRQRNALLRKLREAPGEAQAAHLGSYEKLLAESGVIVARRRHDFLTDLNALAAPFYGEIGGDREEMSLTYRPSLGEEALQDDSAEENYRDRLAANRESDWRRSSTGLGPHRDDFDFLLDGRSARDFGSQGQRRSCVLALRLGEVGLMEATTGEAPLLLLDDLISELDANRRDGLLRALPANIQTIMTATNADALTDWGREARRLEINAGAIVD